MSGSNLSAERYGYDFVVATTQKSINATMKRYLHGIESDRDVYVCYVADAKGIATGISYEDLLVKAKGSDPFKIPNNADPSTNQDLQNLLAARFMGGFHVRLGVPDGWKPENIPDIVSFDAGAINQVVFQLFCAEFDVVQMNNSGWGAVSWTAMSQNIDDPWLFVSKVDLSQSEVDKSAYSQMPPAVQKQIKAMGSKAFSVQQLWFNLTTALLYSAPEIKGVARDSDLGMILQREFLVRYFDQLRKHGQPLLGVNIVDSPADASTFTLTNYQPAINPYVDQDGRPLQSPGPLEKNAATLNYLCATDSHVLPPATQFKWNWLNLQDLTDHHGVVSINRNTFAKWIDRQISWKLRKNCIQPRVTVKWDSGLNYDFQFHDGNANTVLNPYGPDVLKIDYTSEKSDDQAGLNGALGAMASQSWYNATVKFEGNKVIVVQNLKIWLYVRLHLTRGDGNIVDRTITDTYTIGVGGDGKLEWHNQSVTDNRDYDPSVNKFLNFFNDLQSIINRFRDWARNFVSVGLGVPPLNELGDFVFPGGQVFAFRTAGFSDYQDFTSLITYLDPTAPVYKAVIPDPLRISVKQEEIEKFKAINGS